MSKKNVAAVVEELLTPTITELGYRIWDVEYGKIGTEYHLEITIDADDGIDIEDCERVHRAIDPLLDEADPIEGAYRLEVSSPGIEREIRTDAHYMSCIGDVVELRFFAPVDGAKSMVGALESYEDGKITIVTPDDNTHTFDKKDVSRARTVFFED